MLINPHMYDNIGLPYIQNDTSDRWTFVNKHGNGKKKIPHSTNSDFIWEKPWQPGWSRSWLGVILISLIFIASHEYMWLNPYLGHECDKLFRYWFWDISIHWSGVFDFPSSVVLDGITAAWLRFYDCIMMPKVYQVSIQVILNGDVCLDTPISAFRYSHDRQLSSKWKHAMYILYIFAFENCQIYFILENCSP